MLNVWGKSKGRTRATAALHEAVVARAREPLFFTGFGVADTIDGRFDLLVLHAWLVLERLRAAGLNDLSQSLTNAIFTGFDEGLRDLGAGDMGIGRRMKKMADAFYGRLSAYQNAGDETALAEAIHRNLHRGAAGEEGHARTLARYALRARAHLQRQALETGNAEFGPLPETAS
jgi:cytochrome b pre-mRNA-processing protein 3